MKQSGRRVILFLTVFLVGGGLLGGLLGGRSLADSGRPDDEIWAFAQMLALVEDEFVGKIESRDLMEHAIDGLLGALDPHSNYLNPESFHEMRDEQRGRFHGLGIQITKRGPDKPLTIIAPIDGTPASDVGLQSGDIIAEIEGEPTIDLTVQQAVRRLKGDKGTRVTITIQRPGLAELFEVTIERDEIPIQSVRVAYMIDPDIGVVRIANFNSTTADELDASIAALREQGMRRLILDLRGNPGGLLDQAVQVSERFLAPGQKIVYTRGRIPGSIQDFAAAGRGAHVDLPLIVLVDHSSASASEIVSGAIQDHDRGLLIGETTFGKGLVQRVIPLQDGGALAVTTAKYYTPAGRLIQRDYSDLDDYYLHSGQDEGDDDKEPGLEIGGDDAAEGGDDREVFFTDAGRKVFGGGGISPDHVVKARRSPEVISRLRRENLIFDFAVEHVAAHPDISRDFRVNAAMIADFKRFLGQRGFEHTDEELDEARELVGLRLRAQVARLKWGQADESRIIAERDPQIQSAIELFPEAEGMLERAIRRLQLQSPVDGKSRT